MDCQRATDGQGASQMDGQDESKNKEIYEKACEEDLAALGRLGFMCKNYKKY